MKKVKTTWSITMNDIVYDTLTTKEVLLKIREAVRLEISFSVTHIESGYQFES